MVGEIYIETFVIPSAQDAELTPLNAYESDGSEGVVFHKGKAFVGVTCQICGDNGEDYSIDGFVTQYAKGGGFEILLKMNAEDVVGDFYEELVIWERDTKMIKKLLPDSPLKTPKRTLPLTFKNKKDDVVRCSLDNCEIKKIDGYDSEIFLFLNVQELSIYR